MGQSEINHSEFEVSINLNGAEQAIKIKTEETTDGAAYFKCSHADHHLTQIRQEKDGSWEQIWGELDNETVQALGKAINAHTS